MPASGVDDTTRRSVVPPAAARSLWLASVWTGVGAALVGAVVAIVAVAVLWLPAAGGAGSAGSAIRAGVLTFLASLHGGVTVDGLDSAFLPLGLMIAAGVIAWRAGRGLADAAAALGETDPGRLSRVGVLQIAAFGASAGVMAATATLGTSGASVPGTVLTGSVLFAATATVAFVRATPLADEVAAYLPNWAAPAARIAASVLAVYLAAGALLVTGSLVVHHAQVSELSRQVGGGWAGLPILLLGVLAAPNAAVAGAAYLAGPGFAVGSGTTVALGSSPTGRLPAFPILAALPGGPAPVATWLLAVLTPLAAGVAVARLSRRTGRSNVESWRVLGFGVGAAGVLGTVLAWQAGGRIGSARLHAVGASPWQFGLVVLGGAGIAGAALVALAQALAALRSHERTRDAEPTGPLATLVSTLGATVEAAAADFARRDDTDGSDGGRGSTGTDPEPAKGDRLAG